MLKRRPPWTTLETRLTSTTVSSRFSFEASILAIVLLFWPCRDSIVCRLYRAFPSALKFQTAFARAFGKRRHTPMILIAAAIKHHLTDALLLCAPRQQFANLARDCHLAVIGNCRQCLQRGLLLAFLRGRQDGLALRRSATLLRLPALLCLSALRRGLFRPRAFASLHGGNGGGQLDRLLLDLHLHLRRSRRLRGYGWFEVLETLIQRRGRNQGCAGGIIYNLCIDMVATAKHIQARAGGRAGQVTADTAMPPQSRLICMKLLNHRSTTPGFITLLLLLTTNFTGLPGLPANRLTRVANALALVGFRLANRPDGGRDLTDQLLINATHTNLGGLCCGIDAIDVERDAGRWLHLNRVGIANQDHQIIANFGRAIANAVNL